MSPTQCAVKAMFLWRMTMTAPCSTFKADGKHYLPLRDPDAPFSSSAQEKRSLFVVQNPIIFHENARYHTAGVITDLLRRWQWGILEHPQYSSDFSSFDYEIFAKVKEPLRGIRITQEMNLSVL